MKVDRSQMIGATVAHLPSRARSEIRHNNPAERRRLVVSSDFDRPHRSITSFVAAKPTSQGLSP
jgi:hypothetical protein